MAGDSGGLGVRIDPQVWVDLKRDLDRFDPALAKSLRRRLKTAGIRAQKAVQEELGKPSPDGGPDLGTGRAALIAATKITVSFTKRAAGVKIRTTSNGLAEKHKGLLMVYNKDTFRHPVFARNGRNSKGQWKDKVVEQKGRPYFGKVIQEEIRKRATDDIFEAIDDAMAEVISRTAAAASAGDGE